MNSKKRGTIYFAIAMVFGFSLLFAFQNCGPKISSIPDTESISYELASQSPSGDCEFNGVSVREGDSILAYKSPSAPDLNQCESQEQICEAGVLRSINGGSLFRYPQCRQMGSAACSYTVSGQPTILISHNAPAKFYNTSEVDLDQSCEDFTMNRYCKDGSFGGDASFRFTKCVQRPPVNCVESGITILHRTSKRFYREATVPYNQDCAFENRTCYNGTLTGTFKVPDGQCVKQAARNCTLDGVEILHGAKKPFFKSRTVPFGETCVAKDRTCTDGALGGDAEYAVKDCAPVGASSCSFNGINVGHNQSVAAYKLSVTPATLPCEDPSNMVQRKCFNGVMDPAQSEFAFSSCKRDVPQDCTTADGQKVTSGTTLTLFKVTGMYPPKTCDSDQNSESVTCTNGQFSSNTTARLKNCAPVSILAPPIEPQGGGGSYAFDFICPFGKVATGFHGRAGNELDAIGLVCQDFRSLETFGGGGGRFTRTCPSGKFLVGAYVEHAGSQLSTLGAICAEKNGAGLMDTGRDGAGWGPTFGYRMTCPPGYAVYRITGSHDSRVRRLQVHCARLETPININCGGTWLDLMCPNGPDNQYNKERFQLIQPPGGTGSACDAPNNSVRDRPEICYQESGGG